MYTFTFLVRKRTGAYSEAVHRLESLAETKRKVFSVLRFCRKRMLSAVLIVREQDSGGEYWIDTYRGRVAAHWKRRCPECGVGYVRR